MTHFSAPPGPQPLTTSAEQVRPHAPPVSTFGGTQVLRPDVVRVRLPMVNVYMLGMPGEPWVLVDAGMPGTAGLIRAAAQRHHGNRPPEAILLTHGHLDHIGALHALLETWRVPVYAHPLELPHLTGEAAYPFPDPTVGGVMSLLSPAFVPGPFDFRPYIQALPEGGELPLLPGWRWLHTPGHTAGHVSLWREADRTLIVGDAFVTTKQESALSALTKRDAQAPPFRAGVKRLSPEGRPSRSPVFCAKLNEQWPRAAGTAGSVAKRRGAASHVREYHHPGVPLPPVPHQTPRGRHV